VDAIVGIEPAQSRGREARREEEKKSKMARTSGDYILGKTGARGVMERAEAPRVQRQTESCWGRQRDFRAM
jgi:hypothetical protein